MGELHSRTDSLIEQEYRTLQKIGYNEALREVKEMVQSLKELYAIFGRPDDGQVDKAMDEILTKVEEMLKG